MKYLIVYLTVFFASAISYAQSTGSVSGNLLDFESNNEPLIFGKVSIKETGFEVLSDEEGIFKFENLNEGKYTLVTSFTGYTTKETQIIVKGKEVVSVKIELEASTISLEDLMLTMASADNQAKAVTNN